MAVIKNAVDKAILSKRMSARIEVGPAILFPVSTINDAEVAFNAMKAVPDLINECWQRAYEGYQRDWIAGNGQESDLSFSGFKEMARSTGKYYPPAIAKAEGGAA